MGLTRKFKRRKSNKKYHTYNRSKLSQVMILNNNEHTYKNTSNKEEWLEWLERFITTGTNFIRRLDFSSSVFLRILVDH